MDERQQQSAAAPVLVVDDEPRNRRLLEGILSAAGYATRTAASGAEALAAVASELPQAILLDVMMPDIEGIEVCRRIKADPRTRTLPILLVTALSDTAVKVRGLDSGADDFVTKPVDRGELLARLRTQLRMKCLVDEVLGNREEIARQNDSLRELERSRQELVGMLVHDLKNPLVALQLGLELHQQLHPEGAGSADRTLDYVSEAASRLGTMVNNILDVSRLEEARLPLRRSSVDVAALARAASRTFRAACSSGRQAIEVEALAPLPLVLGDAELIARVLENLVANALDHSEEGAPLGIVVEPWEESPGGVRVTVADRGNGVPEELRAAIFEKYQRGEATAARSFGNKGLGLTFCKLAVEAHGGRIWVEPRDGGGSLFRFLIPASPAAEPVAAAAVAAES